MRKAFTHWQRRTWPAAVASLLTLFAWWVVAVDTAGPAAPARLAEDYTKHVQPLLKQYCLKCHSQKAKKGDLDLERFASIEHARKDVRAWQLVVEMLENGEMPPKKETQLRPDERQRLVTWSRRFLEAEARRGQGTPAGSSCAGSATRNTTTPSATLPASICNRPATFPLMARRGKGSPTPAMPWRPRPPS